jgi:uncharacterized membrane protein (UPF0127 family)
VFPSPSWPTRPGGSGDAALIILALVADSSRVDVDRIVDSAGRTLVEQCSVADKPWSRMRGLLGRRALPPGEGILLRPAGSVHMFFMRFAIDVVWLDRDLGVLEVTDELRPWRTAARRGAKAALEIAAGECARRGIRVGDRLRLAEPQRDELAA